MRVLWKHALIKGGRFRPPNTTLYATARETTPAGFQLSQTLKVIRKDSGNVFKMMSQYLFVSLCITLVSSLPAAVLVDDEYPLTADPRNLQENDIVPQKRAALVLDRLLVALQKALRENPTSRFDAERDGPRTAPLRLAHYDTNDMTGLQRRGQGNRGRVLRCYFNAITCF